MKTKNESPEVQPDWVSVIKGLTKPQQDALSRICCGDDSCLNSKTAKALVAKGLIIYELIPEGSVLSLYRADVASVAVHYAWCVWCGLMISDEDLERGGGVV